MNDTGYIEAARELYEDLENLVELAKQGRAPIRAISLVERACVELHAYLDEVEGAQAWLANLQAKTNDA